MTKPNVAVEDEDGFTELRDPNVPRLDGVSAAANGTPWFFAKQAESKPGLFDPAFVRDLIGKQAAEPEPPREDTVTMTGSPGAIAKLMHEAALRSREREEIAKAEKSTKEINDLPDSDFAFIEPGGTKDDEGKTVPRELRHFPLMDEAHVRNALSRAPESPFGDEAMPKIRAAAKKFGIDVAKEAPMDEDALDPTLLLAESDGEAPGMDTDPGSPAWEAVDAATARKWTAILARAKAAVDMLAERELLEAASADPDDAENAWDLQDACCAIDYAISVLAPFAVAEQAEADCCDDMQMVGKALASFDPEPLDTIEALSSVAKAGRVLSTANEQAIRGAVESLQKVLASLPSAPTTDEVAKTANEEDNMPEPTLSSESTEASGQEPAMGIQQAEPMEKADGDKPEMVAVFNANGKLVGIVDPSKITPVSGASADEDDTKDETDDSDASDAEAVAPETTDLTPEPPAEAGTPADAVPTDDEAVAKTTNETDTTSEEVLKSIVDAKVAAALTEYRTAQEQDVAKQADDRAQLVELIETLKGRVQALEEQPAEPRVFTNGVQPPRDLRGMNRGAFDADVQKALDRRRGLYQSDNATDQNRLANEMQAEAIARLREIQRG